MAENNSSAPLLPCPFCGGAAAVQKESPAGGGYFVECKSCRASTNLRYACGDNPVPLLMERWNARAPQAAPAAVAVPASWADSEDDKPTSRADLERVLDAWNDTTGALPRDSGWRAEVLGMLHDAYDLGAHQATAGSEAKALAALRYYNSECTGQEPSLSVFQQMVDEALAAAPAVPDERWCPDVCPITGREFFMWVTHHESGADVPTYGGPFDSYTIPTQDKDGSFSCERYDHDFGGWKDWESVGLMLVDDQSFVVAPDNPRYYEIEQFATPALPATEDSSAGDLAEEKIADEMSREERMIVLQRDSDGTPTVWCDPEIADIVCALNSGGVKTVASCSGHGVKPGGIALADGRQLLLLESLEAFNSAMSAITQAEVQAEPVIYVSRGQLDDFANPVHDGGHYLPVRRTPLGLLSYPLYTAPQAQPADALDAAFEAVRKRFCKLPRYSFLLDGKGNVRRVPSFTGNWVEFEAAHTLFEPQSVDAAMAAAQEGGNAAKEA